MKHTQTFAAAGRKGHAPVSQITLVLVLFAISLTVLTIAVVS
jgi:hypothetical protein